jgi:hypothetical protein
MDFSAGRFDIQGVDPAVTDRRWIQDRSGLPVTGWMLSVFNTNSTATNHTTINVHKYTHEELD